MKKKRLSEKYPISRGNQVMALNAPVAEGARREAKTNVYIPTDEQVVAAKDWVDSCKL